MTNKSKGNRSVSRKEHENLAAEWKNHSDLLVPLLEKLRMTGDDALFPGFRLSDPIKEEGQRAAQLWCDHNTSEAVRAIRLVKTRLFVFLRSYCEKSLCKDLRKDLAGLHLDRELREEAENAIAKYEQFLIAEMNMIHRFDPYGAAKMYRDIEDLLNELEDRQKELREARAEKERVAVRAKFERKRQRRFEETLPLRNAFAG